jgi:hypothetical protein
MMNCLTKQIAAAVLLCGALVPAANAEFIRGNAVFLVEYMGSGEDGDIFDPPLLGPGSFVVRSLPYNPDAVDEDPSPFFEFDVLDFSFNFDGQAWDESDVSICECYFTPDGQHLWPVIVDGSLHGMRRDIRYANQTFRIVFTELSDKVVVRSVRRGDHFRIFNTIFDEANSVYNFRFHAINIHVLDPQFRIRGMRWFPSGLHHSFATMAGQLTSPHPTAIGSHDCSIADP